AQHRRYDRQPLRKDQRGRSQHKEGLPIPAVRQPYRRLFRPSGAILSVARNLAWGPLRERVERLFRGWAKGEPLDVTPGAHAPRSEHLPKDTQQTQIALAFPSVPVGHPDYYAARAAAAVLSGGMSSRLFTEVREKR